MHFFIPSCHDEGVLKNGRCQVREPVWAELRDHTHRQIILRASASISAVGSFDRATSKSHRVSSMVRLIQICRFHHECLLPVRAFWLILCPQEKLESL